MIRVACIGSRETTPEIEAVMEKIGRMIVRRGGYISSGNALGADAAYARGANEIDPTHVILYLPWSTYNDELIVEGNRVTWEEKPEWVVVAERHHPRFAYLKRGAKAMMIRNAGILSRANACIALLNPNKIGGGGTGHGWRIAGEMGIPRMDLGSSSCTARALQDFLEKLLTNQ